MLIKAGDWRKLSSEEKQSLLVRRTNKANRSEAYCYER